MICAVAIFLLVSTIGCANAEADSRKLAIPKTLEKLERSQEPIYPYLTQGCKAWEGNCERKWNQEGECEKQEVICKENFYRCSEDDPEAPCCVAEENRPLACPQNSTEPTPTPSDQNTTSNATELDTTAFILNITLVSEEPLNTTDPTPSSDNTTSNATEPDSNTTSSWTLPSTQSDNTTENATEAQTTQGPTPTINLPPAQQCPPNEHFEACPKCGEPKCSDLELRSGGGNDGNDTCAETKHCRGKPRCLCDPDFSRNEAGTCVPDVFCLNHMCGSNTHYEKCPVCHDVNCDEIVSHQGGPQPAPFPPVQISPSYCLADGCRCNVGYARDANGNCARVIGRAPDACDFASG